MIPGVGVEHELLVELATESFAKKPIWTEDSTLLQKPVERDLSMAQYTGGKVEVWALFHTVSRKDRMYVCYVVKWQISAEFFELYYNNFEHILDNMRKIDGEL